MTKPYWQISVDTPRYGCSESVLEHDHDKAMKTLLEKIPTLNAGQTLRLYQVDGSGFVRPEYKIVRE